MSAYKPAKLDASLLLARKGEATPAIHATIHNNPGFAWGEKQHPDDFQAKIYPLHPQTDSAIQHSLDAKPTSLKSACVNIGIKLESDVFLRAHYIAHKMNRTIEDVITAALHRDLLRHGITKSTKCAVTMEKHKINI